MSSAYDPSKSLIPPMEFSMGEHQFCIGIFKTPATHMLCMTHQYTTITNITDWEAAGSDPIETGASMEEVKETFQKMLPYWNKAIKRILGTEPDFANFTIFLTTKVAFTEGEVIILDME